MPFLALASQLLVHEVGLDRVVAHPDLQLKFDVDPAVERKEHEVGEGEAAVAHAEMAVVVHRVVGGL